MNNFLIVFFLLFAAMAHTEQEIYYLSSCQLIEAMKSGELSAFEVMEQHLDRIDKMNPLLNGLIQRLSREDCLKQALQADQRRMNGLMLGKLHGLPITIKDTYLVKRFVSCLGCVGLKDTVAEMDSTIVTRLKSEGAIIVGITNVPEFLYAYETDNDVYGRTNNPYNLEYTPGGSSGGCAALVASGCIPLSIGSDAAGSLRWPAHCTGIATHKPTTGLVPRTGSPLGDAKGLFAQFATPGPMARQVDDLILTLQIISGPDGLDPHCPPVTLKDPAEVDVSSLRVAYFLDDGVSSPTGEVLDVLRFVIQELQNHVIKVDKIECKCLKESYRLLWQSFFLGGDQGRSTQELLKKLGVVIPSPLLQDFLKKAKEQDLSTSQFRNLFREIDQFRIEMLEELKDYDILVSLVAATPAKKHGKCLEESKDMAPCMIHSLTGWPVTVIRCGTSLCGLPIGLQIAAKPWNDHVCLALAKRLESVLGDWPLPQETKIGKICQ